MVQTQIAIGRVETLDECLASMVGRPLRFGADGRIDPEEAERIKCRIRRCLLDAYGQSPELYMVHEPHSSDITLLYRRDDGAWRGLQEWVDERERARQPQPVMPEGMTLAEWNEAMREQR